MPKLTSVMGAGAATTWGEQLDKGSLADQPFWIHNCRPTIYANDQGQDVSLLVLDITLNGPSRHDPHAVITLGNTEERAPILEYFSKGESGGPIPEPLGPCVTFEVPLKGGRSFWRLEDYDEEIVTAKR